MVYTPKALAEFVVERLLASGPGATGARWLDPACGDGVFLTEVVRRLALVVDASDLPDAVARGVFGVDIDEGACGRARDAVRAAVADLSGPQPEAWFDDNVRVADFLELEADPTFTFVVGNPPYVSALHLNAEQKRRYLARFETAWGRLDLYALFIEHGLGFLAIDGTLAYITPDKWLGAESSVRLRTFVSRGFSVRSIDRFDRHDLFPGVAMVPCVSVIARLRSAEQTPGTAACRWWDLDTDGRPIPVGSPEPVRLCSERWTGAHQVSDGTVPLGSLAERISVGLATGLNCCFVVDSDQAQWIEPELLRPVARGRDVLAGEVRVQGCGCCCPMSLMLKEVMPNSSSWPGSPARARIWKRTEQHSNGDTACESGTRRGTTCMTLWCRTWPQRGRFFSLTWLASQGLRRTPGSWCPCTASTTSL